MRYELAGLIRQRGDELLAAALTALALLETALRGTAGPYQLGSVVLTLALGVAAAVRSRHPLLLLGLMLPIAVVSFAFPENREGTVDSDGLFVLLAVYSAAAHASGRTTLVAAGMTVGIASLNVFDSISESVYRLGEIVVFNLIFYGLPWITGRTVRTRRLNDNRLAEEKARAAAAVVAERAQIARELHDVVAHSISVMVLQARGGRRVLESEPTDARNAFGAIERTGEQALDEMRRLLGMLRRTDETVVRAPQPSLMELGALIEQVEAAGLPVQVTIDGEPRDLPPGVDLSAYRIVQEGLTNALKHAGPTRARVSLNYLPDSLELEIADDGDSADSGARTGYGLVGMRERVSVYGGELTAGRRPEGGYTLRVRLPIGSVRA
jgi:signal transduction histidine kinase